MEDSLVVAALSAQLAERIGAKRFELWFKSQARLCIESSVLRIRAANAFVRDWLRNYFADEVRDCWASMVGSDGLVVFDLEARDEPVNTCEAARVIESPVAAQDAKDIEQPAAAAFVEPKAIPKKRRRAAASAGEFAASISRAGVFGSFVVGKSNEYAFRSAELTGRGRQQASPLVFCGPSGVGKTHLLKAILHEFRRHHPGAACVYLTAEQFTTGFVEALRGQGMPSFRQKYRGARLLAIDDLQFFPGKRRTLEELLYTLDSFVNEGRQIVLTTDRPLAELRALGHELVSRLSGGLICEMTAPEFATRMGIVRQLGKEAGIDFDDEVASLIATQITAGARELRGAVHRIQAMSAAFGEPVAKELVVRALAELARHSTRTVRLADVEKVVCEAFGVEAKELRSDRKGRSLVEPRMLAMWLARKYTRSPWSEIGQFFGRHSHSTVISAHRRVEKMIAAQGQVGMANQSCDVDEAIRRLEQALRTA